MNMITLSAQVKCRAEQAVTYAAGAPLLLAQKSHG